MGSLFLPFGKSLALHIVLVVVLVTSMHFSPSPKVVQVSAPMETIEAVTIDESALQQQMQKIQQQKQAQKRAEDKRVAELEKRARDAEQRRRQEEQRLKDLDKKTKSQEAEKRRAEQAAADARKKQQAEEEKAKKLEAERERKERERKEAEEKAAEAKRKREAEEKRLRDAQREAERKRKEAIEKAEQERIMKEQLAKEQAAIASQRRRKYVVSEVDKYSALIIDTINRRWITDQSMIGKQCRVNIRLASNGLVTQVKVLEGDPNVCRTAQAAILKSDTLPMSSEPDVYQELKDITLTLKKEQ